MQAELIQLNRMVERKRYFQKMKEQQKKLPTEEPHGTAQITDTQKEKGRLFKAEPQEEAKETKTCDCRCANCQTNQVDQRGRLPEANESTCDSELGRYELY